MEAMKAYPKYLKKAGESLAKAIIDVFKNYKLNRN